MEGGRIVFNEVGIEKNSVVCYQKFKNILHKIYDEIVKTSQAITLLLVGEGTIINLPVTTMRHSYAELAVHQGRLLRLAY